MSPAAAAPLAVGGRYGLREQALARQDIGGEGGDGRHQALDGDRAAVSATACCWILFMA